MKNLLTIIFLLIGMSAIAQPTASTKGATTDPPKKVLTASDSIVLPIAKYNPTTVKKLEAIDAQIKKLQDDFVTLTASKQTTLETFYGIYCDEKKIDQSKATVKIQADGLIIKILK